MNRRFSKGLTAGLQWTYGHSIGNTGGSNEAQTTQNPFNFEQDRGNNAFDVRHSVNVSVLYQLPVKTNSKAMDLLAGGWEVGGIVNARTGLPMDVTISRPDIVYQINGTNQFVQAPIVTNGVVTTTPVIDNPYGGAFRSNRRPSVVPGVDPFLSTGDKRFFLNPAAFTFPQPGQFGNLGRYALHGPGLSQFDFTLHKKFSIDEKRNVEFRAEIYNLFNRANFANPPAVLATGIGNGLESASTGPAVFRFRRGRCVRRLQLDGQQGRRAGRATAGSVVASLQLLIGHAFLGGRRYSEKSAGLPTFFCFTNPTVERRANGDLAAHAAAGGRAGAGGICERACGTVAGRCMQARFCASGGSRSNCTRAEFPRIFVHEVAHFIWLRLGNPARLRYEDLVRAEIAAGARGELGWSAEWRKDALGRERCRRGGPAAGANTAARVFAIPPHGCTPGWSGTRSSLWAARWRRGGAHGSTAVT